MAERRMFAKTIIDSDFFLDMPLSAQALYFHLSMRADDDGFINNPRKIQRSISAADDDMKLLIAKQFIIPFESGVVVVKHWKIHNYIRIDRYKETIYKTEKSSLSLENDNSYSVGIPPDCQMVYQMETQVRLGKDSIGNSISSEKSDDSAGEVKENDPYLKTLSLKETIESIYSLYPRKEGKAKGIEYLSAYLCKGRKIAGIGSLRFNHEELCGAVRQYAAECEENRTETKFIQLFSTFMNKSVIDFVEKAKSEGYEEFMKGKYGDEWERIKFRYI